MVPGIVMTPPSPISELPGAGGGTQLLLILVRCVTVIPSMFVDEGCCISVLWVLNEVGVGDTALPSAILLFNAAVNKYVITSKLSPSRVR